VEADLAPGTIGYARQVYHANHNLAEMGYNRTAIAGIIRAAENYGVRMLESDLINNQTKGSDEGVMIFGGALVEILDAIMDRSESALSIEQRLESLRRLNH
jgi:hypothetical protein